MKQYSTEASFRLSGRLEKMLPRLHVPKESVMPAAGVAVEVEGVVVEVEVEVEGQEKRGRCPRN